MKCKYCHKPAGWFKRKHKECELKHELSIEQIKKCINYKIQNSIAFQYDSLKEELSKTLSSGYINDTDFFDVIFDVCDNLFNSSKTNSIILHEFINSTPSECKNKIYDNKNSIKFWTAFFDDMLKKTGLLEQEYQNIIQDLRQHTILANALEKVFLSFLETKILQYLEDSVISKEEEDQISNYIEQLALENSDAMYSTDTYNKFVQSLVLRDIQEGKKVDRVKIDSLPILLGKNEYILWCYNKIEGYEEKTGRRYVGGSRGISTRICKGVYYRVGSSKGHSIEYQYQNPLGHGLWIITNKNIYFLGQKQVKIGISKILSYEPYSNGLVIVKDGVNPKPYTFIGFDSWFAVNAMNLLAE